MQILGKWDKLEEKYIHLEQGIFFSFAFSFTGREVLEIIGTRLEHGAPAS
jgi:hypothetical protein